MNFIWSIIDSFWSTVQDVAPIVMLIAFFQIIVLKKSVPNLQQLALGIIFVIIGLSFFLIGLERALFPIGETMALQLSGNEFIEKWSFGLTDWRRYYWVYIFAALIGFSTTIAEPSLIAVATKANEVSGGNINKNALRITVAFGVALALAVGTFRIVTGHPLYIYILAGYFIVLIQTIFAPKDMIALAYDSGGVTTSTVTVPIVAALGLGLSSSVEGSNPAIDGFGLIAFASVFPIISVLAYIQFIAILKKFKHKKR